MVGASYIPFSKNVKLGNCSATMAAQVTCPSACPFFQSGCYAEIGNMGIHTNRMNRAALAADLTSDQVIYNEFLAIVGGRVVPGFPLRLHTVGDCQTDEQARMLSDAAKVYNARRGGPVFTYTHAWRDIKHESWQHAGKIQVLASCETPDEVIEAQAKGYRTALVVGDFERDTLQALRDQGISPVPCPAQTQDSMTCSECRYCMKDAKGTVLFEAHGRNKKRVLVQIKKKNED